MSITADSFPLWLAPVQALVIPIAEGHAAYAEAVWRRLTESGIRAELERRNEAIGKKIRDAELRKIPYIVVVGEREQKENTISFRIHKQGDQGSIALSVFIEKIKKISEEKSLHYEI